MPCLSKKWGQMVPPAGWQPDAASVADCAMAAAFLANEDGLLLEDLLKAKTNTIGALNGTISRIQSDMGPALSSDGVTGYMKSTYAASGNPMSILLWMNHSVGPSADIGAFQWATTLTDSNPYALLQKAAGDATSFRWLVNGALFTSTYTANVGLWHLHSITSDGTTWRSYLNRTVGPTGSTSNSNFAAGAALFTGNGFSDYYAAIFGPLMIFDRVLLPDQICQFYEEPFWWMRPYARRLWNITGMPGVSGFVRNPDGRGLKRQSGSGRLKTQKD